MHGQTFSVDIKKNKKYTLWIFVNAKVYAYPLSIKILSEQLFNKSKFTNNSVTVISIAIMFTLSLIALMSYLSTKKLITLACSVYIGVHGVGWVVASGLLNDIFKQSTTNYTYGGIIIYPFAVAAASQYTKLLFDCDKHHPRLATLLNLVAIISLLTGILLLFIGKHLTNRLVDIPRQ
jgi:hypothetical protein